MSVVFKGRGQNGHSLFITWSVAISSCSVLSLTFLPKLSYAPRSVHSSLPQSLTEASSGSAKEAWESHPLFANLFLLFLHNLVFS